MTDKERIKLMHDELKKITEELREMKSNLYFFMLQKLQNKKEKQMINYMKTDYLNKRVRIRNEEFYGKVLREFASEVLVKVENIKPLEDELYFDKSEVEIVK